VGSTQGGLSRSQPFLAKGGLSRGPPFFSRGPALGARPVIAGAPQRTVADVLSESAELPDSIKPAALHQIDFEVPLYNVWKQQQIGKIYLLKNFKTCGFFRVTARVVNPPRDTF